MYQLPHYSDALKQFPSAALSAYFANSAANTNATNAISTAAGQHQFAAAAAAAAAVVSQTNPFSIDNILAPRPRLPVPLSSYYGSTSTNPAQAAADFYCKYTQLNISFSLFIYTHSLTKPERKGVQPKIYNICL